jgi:predicted DNA-binding transcriptional regulator AlpA
LPPYSPFGCGPRFPISPRQKTYLQNALSYAAPLGTVKDDIKLPKQKYDPMSRYFWGAVMAATEPNWRERLLTAKEAARFLRVSPSWLAKARMRGDGPPYVKLGRSIRYGEDAVVQWTKSRTRLSTSGR